MSSPLPPLRSNLEMFPSADPARPGLVLRDPFRYSSLVIWLPVPLAAALTCFDGNHGLDDLAALIPANVDLPGPPEAAPHERFADLLRRGGLLAGPEYERLRERREESFREARVREAAHAGSAYPRSAEELVAAIDGWLPERGGPPLDDVLAIAAPHVSPHGGPQEYGRAYGCVTAGGRDRTYVVLGTSHYGESGIFGLTRKPFRTPLGETRTDEALVDRLSAAAPAAVKMEDYCHSIEHSIEFQVVFLQRVLGPDVRVLPILCGSLHDAIAGGGQSGGPQGPVGAFLDGLRRIAADEGDRLFWVLGIDLAHVGVRYGDRFEARAGQGRMVGVEAEDRERLRCVCDLDVDGFQKLVVQEGADALRWCGHAPLYTFLRAVGGAYPDLGGRTLAYRQWNIDSRSVVTFAALAFGLRNAAAIQA